MKVWRRRLTAEIIDLMGALSHFPPRSVSALLWSSSKDNETAMHCAAHRLQNAGLIAMRRTRGQPPLMILTESGKSRVADLIWPERWWRKRWTGEWFVLVYDVPEKQRSYRKALQGFLKRLRLGGLQRSVWITPWDIRAEFDDLCEAASVADYAVLFQAQPTFRQSGKEIAARAWDFDRLNQLHGRYLDDSQRRKPALPAGSGMLARIRFEFQEYCQAMAEDPLLPEELYPSDYQGRNVVSTFRRRLCNLMAH
jgi:phenylacetic acid degradation operon negative regulatory protein